MDKNTAAEITEFLPRIQEDISQRFLIANFFLFLMLFIKLVFNIPLPLSLFFLVSSIVLLSIPVDLAIEKTKTKNPRKAINYYFGYLLFDLFLLTLIMNFVGGITWIIPAAYLFYIITFFWLFPRSQAFLLVGWVNVLLLFLIIGNYIGILPSFDIFSPEEKNPQNFHFVFTSTVVGSAILIFLGYSTDSFYQLLQKTVQDLGKSTKELSQTKILLTKEIGQKTRELQEEREKIKKLVKEKTKELEQKKEVAEGEVRKLEGFHKMAVSRELRMAEIKEKIEKLKALKSQT